MILLDTNILSTFTKIERLELLFSVFNTGKLFISPNVFNELIDARRLGYRHVESIFDLIRENGIGIKSPTEKELLFTMELPPGFGPGEQDSIVMVKYNDGTFVTNEKRVINYCKREGIGYITLNHILRLLWGVGILSKDEVKNLVGEIETRDRIVITSREGIFEE